jgi:hypothetical protein
MGSRILYRILRRTTSSTSFVPPLIPIGCDPVKTFLRLPVNDFQASAQYPRCRLGVGTNCAPVNRYSGQSTQTPSTASTNLQRRNFVVWLLEHFPTWAASALYPPSFRGREDDHNHVRHNALGRSFGLYRLSVTICACSSRHRGFATMRCAGLTALNARSYSSRTKRLARSPMACVSN